MQTQQNSSRQLGNVGQLFFAQLFLSVHLLATCPAHLAAAAEALHQFLAALNRQSTKTIGSFRLLFLLFSVDLALFTLCSLMIPICKSVLVKLW